MICVVEIRTGYFEYYGNDGGVGGPSLLSRSYSLSTLAPIGDIFCFPEEVLQKADQREVKRAAVEN